MATATKVDVLATLAMFDLHGGEEVVRYKAAGIPLAEVRELSMEDYSPRGSTPLNDATAHLIHTLDAAFGDKPDAVHIGLLMDESGSMAPNRVAGIEAVNEFVGALRGEEAKGEGRVLVVILTDGLENASRDYDSPRLRSLIVDREAKGWTFIYLGANQDAWAAGAAMGVPQAQSAGWTSSPTGTRTTGRTMGNMGAAYLGETDSMKARAATQDVLSAAASGGMIPEVDAEERKRQQAEAQKRAEEAQREAESKRKGEIDDAVTKARGVLGGE